MTGIDWISIIFGSLGLLMIALAPFAKPNDGYTKPLDPFGPESIFERKVSRQEASYNQNPRLALIKGGIAFIAVAGLMQLFKIF
jgi:hypothetical protein